MTPPVARTVADLRHTTALWRRDGLRTAVVPTMGALHEGHLALIREGKARADRVMVTIFVNPKQFGANEDLARYPRNEAGDLAAVAGAGADLVFAPQPLQMYGPNFATTVTLDGPAKADLEDRFRPHFFDGVATVVAKLFIQSGADVAMFGEKDYQQLLVVRRMAEDLDIPVDVVGVPTIREADGLAMSSRNAYLSPEERKKAPAIHRALRHAAGRIREGANPGATAGAAADELAAQGFRVDYVAARNAETLALPSKPGETLRLIAAAWLGSTRLIDNIGV